MKLATHLRHATQVIANQNTVSYFVLSEGLLPGMDQELLLFRRFLVSPQWINPIRLFIGKAYCGE